MVTFKPLRIKSNFLIESIREYDDTETVELLKALEERLDELEKKDAIIENEMRTIMSDHQGFNDVLKEMGKSGYGDNRQYGNYSD